MSVKLRGSVSPAVFEAIEKAAARARTSRSKFLQQLVIAAPQNGSQKLFEPALGGKVITLTVSGKSFAALASHMNTNGLSKDDLLVDVIARSKEVHTSM